MLRTRVGYAGGTSESPTYYSMGDHTEAFSVDFDPKVITYEDLLKKFWDGHRCERVNFSTQYKNAIFYRNEAQKAAAMKSRDEVAEKRAYGPGDIKTDIVPMNSFTYAEEYHQKYSLTRYRELRAWLLEQYPTAKELADSAVATRLNAYLGEGMEKNWPTFEKEVDSYGLPAKFLDEIEDTLRRRR